MLDSELCFFFPKSLPANERCPLANASSLEDNGRMVYAMKIEIEQAWGMLKEDKESSMDHKGL